MHKSHFYQAGEGGGAPASSPLEVRRSQASGAEPGEEESVRGMLQVPTALVVSINTSWGPAASLPPCRT